MKPALLLAMQKTSSRKRHPCRLVNITLLGPSASRKLRYWWRQIMMILALKAKGLDLNMDVDGRSPILDNHPGRYYYRRYRGTFSNRRSSVLKI
jgi:hypothetical protein